MADSQVAAATVLGEGEATSCSRVLRSSGGSNIIKGTVVAHPAGLTGLAHLLMGTRRQRALHQGLQGKIEVSRDN
jgi:hypothetical protein